MQITHIFLPMNKALAAPKLHATLPWTTLSERLHQANLPQLHTANFVGFAPTLHDDDGLSPPPSSSAASHHRCLAMASHHVSSS
jgi:hypothetical protein